jgi:L-asparaginase II
MDRFDLVARSLRGGLTECWHFGALAVVDAAGTEVARIGDPEVPVFMRSAAKPLQAIAMLELGLERVDIGSIDLALICASHGGCDLHTQRVLGLLARRQLAPEALLCGTQPPLDPQALGQLASRGLEASVLHNNCSGKHAGMLLTCLEAGLSLGDYVDGAHPLQQRIAATVARFCHLEPEAIGVGLDGCSLPTFRVPLSAVARTYASFAAPIGLADAADRERVERIYAAMTTAPEMVAGPGRFTTRLIEVGEGAILGKEGADGLYALAARGARPLGLALKIADGTEICRDGVVLDILERLDLLDGVQLRELAPFRRPERLNRRGRKVGEVVPEVALEIHATA